MKVKAGVIMGVKMDDKRDLTAPQITLIYIMFARVCRTCDLLSTFNEAVKHV